MQGEPHLSALLDEDRLPVARAGREIFKVNGATAWRWCLRGCRGIKLESLLIGGVRYTSREACVRFLGTLNGTPNPQPSLTASRTTRAEAASRKLDALGM